MEQEKINISVKIGSFTIPLKVDSQEEEKYRLAAKLAHEKYTNYEKKFDIDSSEYIMAMTLLDVAKNYIELSDSKEDYSLMLELSDIVDTLTDYLKTQ